MLTTKQNITDKLYKAGLINNTDVQTSAALTDLVINILRYISTAAITTDLSNGTLTPDTYVRYTGVTPNIVDTAQRIVDNY
jgi:hypothetical protein